MTLINFIVLAGAVWLLLQEIPKPEKLSKMLYIGMLLVIISNAYFLSNP